MLNRTFICEVNENMGERGWRPSWQPHFDAYGGMAVAHDTLEHLPGGDGGAEDEIMATGGSWVIRGENGAFQIRGNIHPPHVHMCSDMPDVFERILEGKQTLKDPGRTYRLRNEFDEEIVQLCAEETWKVVRSEFGFREITELYDLLSNSNKTRYIGWLRRGISAARERYRRVDTYGLMYMFERISKQAENLLSDAHVGDELKVSINLKEMKEKVWLKAPGLDRW